MFPKQSREAIDLLVDDPSFQRQIPQLILDRMQKSAGKVLPIEPSIIPLLFSRAQFTDTKESYAVSNLFSKYLNHQGRFLPLAVDHLAELDELRKQGKLTERSYLQKGEDFASRCLFSLSLFYRALERLYARYGAPPPKFYREIGKRTFDRIGQEQIVSNFEDWVGFIREEAFR